MSTKQRQIPETTALTPLHKDIIGLVNAGVSNKDICVQLSCKPHTVYYVKRTHRSHLTAAQITNKTIDIHKYNDSIADTLKYNILNMAYTIQDKDLQKASLPQVVTSMAICIDKLRLIEGKSTQNIATQVLHNMNQDQLDIITASIRSLKESMLGSPKG